MYRVADFLCNITFAAGQDNSPALLPSWAPFAVLAAADERPLFTLHIDDTLAPLSKERCEPLRCVENANGDIIVDHATDGGYQFIIKDSRGRRCCLLQTDSTFAACRCALRGDGRGRTYGLNSALMIVFAFAACGKQTLLIHASVVREGLWAYAFTAKSGVGKSTHAAQWLATIPSCDLLNDDNPIIRVIDGQAYIYGSPWSGKTPCYRNRRALLGAVVKLCRAETNSIVPAPTIDAFVTLLAASATMKWDSTIFENICSSITAFIATTQHFNLFCLPNGEAAHVCHKAISRAR